MQWRVIIERIKRSWGSLGKVVRNARAAAIGGAGAEACE